MASIRLMGEGAKIRAMVRRIVYRTLGIEAEDRKRQLLTEETVSNLPLGDPYVIPNHVLVTPLAREVAMDRRIALVQEAEQGGGKELGLRHAPAHPKSNIAGIKTVAFGADHGGYELKNSLKDSVSEQGFEVIDCGTHNTESVDYPD